MLPVNAYLFVCPGGIPACPPCAPVPSGDDTQRARTVLSRRGEITRNFRGYIQHVVFEVSGDVVQTERSISAKSVKVLELEGRFPPDTRSEQFVIQGMVVPGKFPGHENIAHERINERGVYAVPTCMAKARTVFIRYGMRLSPHFIL